MIQLSRGTGWRPQRPDHRDQIFSAPAPVLRQLPPIVDLRHSGFTPPVWDQGQTNSCTGHGPGALVHFCLLKEGLATAQQVPSRLFAYFNPRDLEGTTAIDAGAEIRDSIKGIVAHGICFESRPDGSVGRENWPFFPDKIGDQPNPECYAAATKDRALSYQSLLQITNQLRACLADGYPFTFGFNVFSALDSPEVAQSGRLTMPGSGEAPIGGHCADAWGYDDDNRCFLIRNSWGGSWGFRGYFLMPYEYILDPAISSDFWTIRLMGA